MCWLEDQLLWVLTDWSTKQRQLPLTGPASLYDVLETLPCVGAAYDAVIVGITRTKSNLMQKNGFWHLLAGLPSPFQVKFNVRAWWVLSNVGNAESIKRLKSAMLYNQHYEGLLKNWFKKTWISVHRLYRSVMCSSQLHISDTCLLMMLALKCHVMGNNHLHT